MASQAGLTPAYMGQVPFIPEAEAATITSPFVYSTQATLQNQAAYYPQSVAAGDPNPNGCVIWTRIDSSATATGGLQQIAWQMATDANFTATSVILQGVALVQSTRDNTVKLPIQNAALQPSRSIATGSSSTPSRAAPAASRRCRCRVTR